MGVPGAVQTRTSLIAADWVLRGVPRPLGPPQVPYTDPTIGATQNGGSFGLICGIPLRTRDAKTYTSAGGQGNVSTGAAPVYGDGLKTYEGSTHARPSTGPIVSGLWLDYGCAWTILPRS